MKISMGMSQGMELRQTMSMQQKIELSNLLTTPDEVLKVVTGAIAFNPDSIEGILQKGKKDKAEPNGFDNKIQNIYASLTPSKGDIKSSENNSAKSGMIITPNIELIEGSLQIPRAELTPDVTYIGRKDEKPELVLSDHLKGAMLMLQVQIDEGKYPETTRLIKRLKQFDDWKRKVMREAYVLIGGAQREYFENFERKRCNMYAQENVAHDLDLSASTISRILSNRWIEARNIKGEQKFIYAKDLLVTRDDYMRYAALPKMNQIFAKEFEDKKAYSDNKMAKMLGNVAQRTVTKYRLVAKIPHASKRRKEYSSGTQEAAYKIDTSI